MEVKKDILWRIYLAFLIICVMGLAIIVQIVRIQFVQGDEWRAKQDSRGRIIIMKLRRRVQRKTGIT